MNNSQRIGRYVVDRLLGEGAMGSVYKAKDPLIDRDVAIKTVKMDRNSSSEEAEEFLKRFQLEAQVSGRLNHPNIVGVFDVGDQDGVPYIAMEYVTGCTLDRFLRDNGRKDPELLLKILDQIAVALDFAHEKGIVHRDLKPANIMVMEDTTAKIMDFGIAKMSGSSLTMTGVFLGTPSYSSPEQIKEGQVDHRSDIFSFGILANEVLTGCLPFAGQSINAILYKIANEPPKFAPNLKDLPVQTDKWRDVFEKVLHKEPDKRYQTAGEFTRAMHHCMQTGTPVGASTDKTRIAAVNTATVMLDNTHKDLKRSEFEMAQATIPPTQTGAKKGPILAFLLFLTAAVGAAGWFLWESGRLESLLNPAQTQQPVVVNETPAPAETAPVETDEAPKPIVEAPVTQPAALITRTISVASQPAGAMVHIAGKDYKTPFTYQTSGSPGDKVNLSVTSPGYKSLNYQLTLAADLPAQLNFPLELDAVTRMVTVQPNGATVSVDGKSMGAAPASIRFEPGKSYKIVVRAAGFLDRSFTYTEGKSSEGKLNIKMKPVPPPGTLVVKSLDMPDLTVTVAGKTYRAESIKLEAGSHRVKLTAPSVFYQQTARVTIESGKNFEFETPIVINIPKIEYIGGYVQVKIDGRFVKRDGVIDTTPLVNLKLAAGPHTFEYVTEDGKIVAKRMKEVKRSEGIIVTADN